MTKKLKDFNTFEVVRKKEFETFGILYINDISTKFDFMFSDWNIDIIRPKIKEPNQEGLIEYLSEKFQALDKLNQEYFLL